MILLVLLAGYLPFEEATLVALFRKIKRADFTFPSWFPAESKQLISQIHRYHGYHESYQAGLFRS